MEAGSGCSVPEGVPPSALEGSIAWHIREGDWTTPGAAHKCRNRLQAARLRLILGFLQSQRLTANCPLRLEAGRVPETVAECFGALRTCFSRAHENYTLSDEGAVATYTSSAESWRTAASDDVMTSGRHFAEFTVLKTRGSPMVGVIAPSFDVETGRDGFKAAKNKRQGCFFDTTNGVCRPGDEMWSGNGSSCE